MTSDNSIPTQTSCADDFDPDTLSAEQAGHRIAALVRPVNGCEKVAVRSALNRTLAEDVYSTVNVPAHTNSAMDGYAIRSSDLPAEGSISTLAVVGTAWAGRPYHGMAQSEQCVRIMTGAKMPEGLDTVIMQEQVECTDNIIRIGPGHKPGQNVRQAGEDLAIGEVAVPAGKRYPLPNSVCLPHWESPISSLRANCGWHFSRPETSCARSVNHSLKVRSMTVTVTPYTGCWRV